jgi:uncharacterized membrane protein (UPF0136 family)
MIAATKVFYIVFGALAALGGFMGYLKAGSMISLVAGGLCGALLVAAALWLRSNVVAGLALGAIVSVALAGQFVPKLMKEGPKPHFVMLSILSVASVAMSAAAFIKR